jgi:peptide/nickel transport system permease protein
VDAYRQELGLDRPLGARLLSWYAGLAQGDMGESLFYGVPVVQMIAARLEPTLLVTLMATLCSILIGGPLGILAALKAGSAADLGAMVIALFGVSIPSFWLGLNLILLFALRLQVLPTAGYVKLAAGGLRTFQYLLLPSLALGLSHSAVIARMVRANLLEVLNHDYVRTARAKGLAEYGVVLKHALRTAMVPTLGVIGVSIALMLGGAIIIEVVFVVPGIGKLVVDAIMKRDFPMIQGVLMFIALTTAMVNLLVDILYGVLDPRIRYH